MSRYRGSDVECKVYVGDLPRDATEKEIQQAFCSYGPIKNIWVARNPPGFAFVEFEDPRDAEDSVRELDGRSICGVRARVELSTGKSKPKPWMRGGDSSSGGSSNRRAFDPSDKCFECGERGHYAYDCKKYGGGGSRQRSYSRSRSRSPRYRNNDRSRDRYRSRS